MRAPKTDQKGQSGQALILFSFMIVVLLICVMAVVDVGFFLHNRETAQQTADAAALAGSQELPADPVTAEAVARDYVARNGLDPDSTTVSFKCTSQSAAICLDGDGRYDTIVVTPSVQSPTFFGAVLSFIGVESCWVEGCPASARAAGCRGACGPIGTGPADIMTILDHSKSVDPSDLALAKSAISSMFTNFNYNYQQVGLAVTPPTRPDDMCDTIDYWNDPQVWMPSGLTNTFQVTEHVLNPTSPPVLYADCVDTPGWGELNGYHTNLGTPLKDAADELAANGRPDVAWGIILLTDGAANVAPSSSPIYNSTGERFCTSQAAVTSGSGDNNGYENSSGNACANSGGVARDYNSGTSTSTNCSSSNKDRHLFWGFGADAGIPAGATIEGIEVRTDAYVDSLGGWWSGGTRRLCVEVSWDGGISWSSTDTADFTSTGERTYYTGGSSYTWGHTWSTSDLANLVVRVTNVSNSSSTDFSMDAVAVNVTYSTSSGVTANKGPCDWAMQQATAAKALGIEVYTIGWGVPSGDSCKNDDWDSPYYGMNAKTFLKALATDDAHYFDQPKNSDLTEVFNSIGSSLTSGSRLVE